MLIDCLTSEQLGIYEEELQDTKRYRQSMINLAKKRLEGRLSLTIYDHWADVLTVEYVRQVLATNREGRHVG